MAVPVKTDLPHWWNNKQYWHAEKVLETIACGFTSVHLLFFWQKIPLLQYIWLWIYTRPPEISTNNFVGTSDTGLL